MFAIKALIIIIIIAVVAAIVVSGSSPSANGPISPLAQNYPNASISSVLQAMRR